MSAVRYVACRSDVPPASIILDVTKQGCWFVQEWNKRRKRYQAWSALARDSFVSHAEALSFIQQSGWKVRPL